MSDVHVLQTHGTDRADAARRTRTLFDGFVAERSELFKDVRWSPSGDKAEVTGRGFKGHLEVDDREVRVHMKLGLLARAFKGRIEEGLGKKLAEEFESA